MKRSLRRTFALLLAVVLTFAFIPSALAVTDWDRAAEKLHTLGMVAGTGTNPDGSINYDLYASINRAQAVTLVVNLLGKYDEATSQTWVTPFTDVPGWALPFVGYAYAHQITAGISETKFGATDPVLPKQYITFVLNALGYQPGVDFQYDTAWEKSDELGFTDGSYAFITSFDRGDAIAVTYDSLSAIDKSTGKPFYEKLIAAGIFTADQWASVNSKGAEILPTFTIAIPGATNFNVSFKNVFDAYFVFNDEYIDYFFLVDEDGEISFTEDIKYRLDVWDPYMDIDYEESQKGLTLKKGEWLGVSNTYFTLYFDTKGNFLGSDWEEIDSDVEIGFTVDFGSYGYHGYYEEDFIADSNGSIKQFAVK